MERLLIAFQYCVMFVPKECLIFGILLHHLPFDPAWKDGSSRLCKWNRLLWGFKYNNIWWRT